LIKDALNRLAAVKFLEFMLAPEGGLKVLKEMGQPPFIPARVKSLEVKESLPGTLPELVEVNN
jgi:molybdate/tungstate transport system substrate-binding protein